MGRWHGPVSSSQAAKPRSSPPQVNELSCIVLICIGLGWTWARLDMVLAESRLGLDLSLAGPGLGWTWSWLDLGYRLDMVLAESRLGLDLSLAGPGLGWTWSWLDLDLGWTWAWMPGWN